jgi:hypothetical protein
MVPLAQDGEDRTSRQWLDLIPLLHRRMARTGELAPARVSTPTGRPPTAPLTAPPADRG